MGSRWDDFDKPASRSGDDDKKHTANVLMETDTPPALADRVLSAALKPAKMLAWIAAVSLLLAVLSSILKLDDKTGEIVFDSSLGSLRGGISPFFLALTLGLGFLAQRLSIKVSSSKCSKCGGKRDNS